MSRLVIFIVAIVTHLVTIQGRVVAHQQSGIGPKLE